MRLAFIDQKFDVTNIGGAFKSNYAIINELIKNPDFQIEVLATKTKTIRKNNLSVKQIRPVLKSPSKKINSLIKFFKINQYLSFFPICKEIKKFKPDFIIVQRDLTFTTLLIGLTKKIPVVNIIRDGMGLCPKFIDTKGFKNCSGSIRKKDCWDCINKWRSLKILFEGKPISSNYTLISSFYTVYYKLHFILTKIHLSLMKYAYVNIVASPLMKDLVEKRINSNRVFIKKITPIDKSNIIISSNHLDKNVINRIKNSNKVILFVIPRNEGGSKGFPFVKMLLKKFPKDYLIIVVGTIIDELLQHQNVININKIPINNLYYLYQKANLTIMPSIYTEAFGRVVLESIINKTPIIVSPQTGANYLFKNKNYVKILPLKVSLWVKEIKKFLEEPIIIPDDDIRQIEKRFSPIECTNELINLISNLK